MTVQIIVYILIAVDVITSVAMHKRNVIIRLPRPVAKGWSGDIPFKTRDGRRINLHAVIPTAYPSIGKAALLMVLLDYGGFW